MAILHDYDPIDADPKTKRLAKTEGLGSVTMCGCGTISLNVQTTSIRLDLQAFAQLLLLCSDAMDVLEAMARLSASEPQPNAVPFVH